MKKISIKTAILLVSISILVSSSIVYVLAQTPTETLWISGGSYPRAPNFTVWVEGSNFFAKNHLGRIVYSGSNATTVLQNTFSALASSGGDCYIKEGTYDLDAGLYVDLRTNQSCSITGELGAVLLANSWLEAPVWSCFIEFYSGKDVTVSGLTLNDNSQGAAYGLRFSGYAPTYNIKVFDCRFLNFINSTTTYLGMGIVDHRGNNHDIYSNYFENCEQGIVFTSNGNNQTNLHIHDNTFVGCGHPINLEIQTSYVMSNVHVTNNLIFGSALYTRGLTEAKAGVNVWSDGNSFGFVVSDNSIYWRVGENATGIRITRIHHVVVSGNNIINAHYNDTDGTSTSRYPAAGAIQVRGSLSAVIEGNTIRNGTVGINLYQYTFDPDYNTVTGNTIYDVQGDGFYLHRTTNSSFVNNIVYSAGRWGLEEGYSGVETKTNTVVASHFFECTSGGIFFFATSGSHANLCWNGTSWLS